MSSWSVGYWHATYKDTRQSGSSGLKIDASPGIDDLPAHGYYSQLVIRGQTPADLQEATPLYYSGGPAGGGGDGGGGDTIERRQ